jgi:hypothetical protein
VAGELGPLKYLSGLTGYPMDKIINILLSIIIFVFDPLAAITNDTAKGSNTKIIINSKILIILSIGYPVSPDRYFNGPNSPATSTLFSSSNILRWYLRNESTAISLLP